MNQAIAAARSAVNATYANPWHANGNGPERYTTDVKPTSYRGCLIYQRVAGSFDVVENGVCLTQRAGLRGAKKAIDLMLDDAHSFEARRMREYRVSARMLEAQQVAA